MFTCIGCQVAFVDPERQKEHFQSEWHRYNLKRKVADFPPVTLEQFNERTVVQKSKENEEHQTVYCDACKKVFANKKSFENHIKSKKHLEMAQIMSERALDGCGKNTKGNNSEDDEDIEVEEVDSDEWEDDPIPITDCLFCFHKSRSLKRNLMHMTTIHSFFVPDLIYCSDMDGLVKYLGEKVGCYMECLWCCGKSPKFLSVDAVQNHMRDKGHCMMKFEGETLLEYCDFYDYSSSYPDSDSPNVKPDDVIEPERLCSDGYELTLPSGATIGHRSLLRYYKQRINPNRNLVLHKNSGSIHSKIMAHYRALGWSGATKAEVVTKARDMAYMHRIQRKQWIQVGIKANKLQPHFRAQVMF